MPIDLETYARKVEDEIERFIGKVVNRIAADAVTIIDRNDAKAWGEMRKNVTSEVYKEAAKIVGIAGVRSNVPYAIFRHEGTRPHWPPQVSIRAWVIRKGLVKLGKRSATLGKLQSTKKNTLDPFIREANKISFLIARKISKKGTKGLPFLRMALNQNRSWIEGELSKLKLS